MNEEQVSLIIDLTIAHNNGLLAATMARILKESKADIDFVISCCKAEKDSLETMIGIYEDSDDNALVDEKMSCYRWFDKLETILNNL